MVLILFFIFLILLFIFPIPLKFEISFNNNIFNLKLFNFNIFSSNNGIENKFLRKLIYRNKVDLKKEKTIKYKDKDKKAFNFWHIKRKKIIKKISIKKLYNNISCNKFKPLLKINGQLNFGIEDAAYCAILYGLINNVPTLLKLILNKVFLVKDIKLGITPKFNTNIISFGITSIFYFNIANIIYILYLIYKSFEIKEVTPE